MGRPRLQEPRRKEIIKAFYKLAKKEGLENASIAKTAALIQINPSLVMYYFKTKDHLIYGLVEYILDRYLLIFKPNKGNPADPLKLLKTVIDNIFSQKWNTLFDDGVFYSCYALVFRSKKIKKEYKDMSDSLRRNLADLITDCKRQGMVAVEDPELTADLIFLLVDGAYYYLSLTSDPKEYAQKIIQYKKRALVLLNLS